MEPGTPLEDGMLRYVANVDDMNCFRRVFFAVGFRDFLSSLLVFLKVNDSLSLVDGSIVTCLVDVEGDLVTFYDKCYWSTSSMLL